MSRTLIVGLALASIFAMNFAAHAKPFKSGKKYELHVILQHPNPAQGKPGYRDGIEHVLVRHESADLPARIELKTASGGRYLIPFVSEQAQLEYLSNLGRGHNVFDLASCYELGEQVKLVVDPRHKKCGDATYVKTFHCRANIQGFEGQLYDIGNEKKFLSDYYEVDPASGAVPTETVYQCDYSRKRK